MEKRSEFIGVKVTPTVKAQIEEIAKLEARPTSSLINLIIERYIKEYHEKNRSLFK